MCQEGEGHACLKIRCRLEDPTVFAVLKQLKQMKVIHFDGMLLQYPQHKDAAITLVDGNFMPGADMDTFRPELTLK